jgi:hypothetical protein
MSKVITVDSDARCNHAAGEASSANVTLLAGQDVLKIDGALVVAQSLATAIISSASCKNKPPPNSNVPCAASTAQTAGESTVLKVNGTAVVLETATGTTGSTPPGTWAVKDAAQTVLNAD